MIKRETIKQAIDAISANDPGIGYALFEMFGAGIIDAGAKSEGAGGEEFHFIFDRRKVAVNKFVFLNEGTAPVEQGLVRKYGELIKKRELEANAETEKYVDAASLIREAGLRLMVNYEIDLAITDLKQTPGISDDKDEEFASALIAALEGIKNETAAPDYLEIAEEAPGFHRGFVGDRMPALFAPFPFSLDSLMQAAELDLEFFHVRFILGLLKKGLADTLYVCLADRRIQGLAQVILREKLFYRAIEINYMATARGKAEGRSEISAPALKGVGTFLVAGIWMLWKNAFKDVKEIVLDSEIRARSFYKSTGFHPRGTAQYALRKPTGRLLYSIVNMSNNCERLRPSITRELLRLIERELNILRKKTVTERMEARRENAAALARECLRSGARPEFSREAASYLVKHRQSIPEFDELEIFAREHGSGEARDCFENAARSGR